MYTNCETDIHIMELSDHLETLLKKKKKTNTTASNTLRSFPYLHTYTVKMSDLFHNSKNPLQNWSATTVNACINYVQTVKLQSKSQLIFSDHIYQEGTDTV